MKIASARRSLVAFAFAGAAAVVAAPLFAGPARTPLLAPKPAVADAPASADGDESPTDWKSLTDTDWKKRLTPEQYKILRKHGTERAGTGKYEHSKVAGVYECAGCEQPLFVSDAKYDSGCGWPSFTEPVDGLDSKAVGASIDRRFGMVRTEVHCKNCGGHLGHVFNDGPGPNGLRFCINSASLTLDPTEAAPGSDAVGKDAPGNAGDEN
ncbi:peptide-methionine (R)-S-oxide reductase MsrB [Alienimonas californiensis]|uniref:peptide-methionine (R)-S-oxide reductase n=1 Tax=Alienimonas californiensis TaxID=2527989 RepID=A0A517P9A9_9PLAN|nr:peptide-methionine (R)-S-oxide reductase MsrB [Alienimonas californiensis]QDT15966.1 Peptide methionine sulfoxide reductase MsrB [Alienimonas californiensis]